MSTTTIARPDLRARQVRLQDYQAMLARRLREARTLPAVESYLGVQVGARHWLLPLPQTGEIIEWKAASPVPLTQPWYTGLINARGNLLGVIDFGMFYGEAPTPVQAGSKIVVLSREVERACGIVATRVTGLRHAGDLRAAETAVVGHGDGDGGDWRGAALVDRDGRDWRVLDIARLLEAPAFLQAGRQG